MRGSGSAPLAGVPVPSKPAAATANPAPGSAHPAAASAKPSAAAASTGGKVVETMDSGGYTYVRVETAGGEKWAAGPATAVRLGDNLSWSGGSEMRGFVSKTLGRTFDSILFVDGFVVGGAAATGEVATGGTAAPRGGAAAAGAPHGELSNKAADGEKISGIAKAEGGLTVAEIYNGRADLEGKEILVRGKVVKFNSGIMDRNWVHVRDGSEGSGGENDLTVTTDGQAAVGDTVLVRGKLILNKDFGFNYRYDVLIESAVVTVE